MTEQEKLNRSVDEIIPDLCTMDLIIDEHRDVPYASYIVPILHREYPHMRREAIIQAIAELWEFGQETGNSATWVNKPLDV